MSGPGFNLKRMSPINGRNVAYALEDNNAFPNSTRWISGPHLHSMLISDLKHRHVEEKKVVSRAREWLSLRYRCPKCLGRTLAGLLHLHLQVNKLPKVRSHTNIAESKKNASDLHRSHGHVWDLHDHRDRQNDEVLLSFSFFSGSKGLWWPNTE